MVEIVDDRRRCAHAILYCHEMFLQFFFYNFYHIIFTQVYSELKYIIVIKLTKNNFRHRQMITKFLKSLRLFEIRYPYNNDLTITSTRRFHNSFGNDYYHGICLSVIYYSRHLVTETC